MSTQKITFLAYSLTTSMHRAAKLLMSGYHGPGSKGNVNIYVVLNFSLGKTKSAPKFQPFSCHVNSWLGLTWNFSWLSTNAF